MPKEDEEEFVASLEIHSCENIDDLVKALGLESGDNVTITAASEVYTNLRVSIGLDASKSIRPEEVAERAIEKYLELLEEGSDDDWDKALSERSGPCFSSTNQLTPEGALNLTIKLNVLLEPEDDEEDYDPAVLEGDKSTKIEFTPLTPSCGQLVERTNNESSPAPISTNPPWQRLDVWSLSKKRKLIRSLLIGIPLPSMIFYSEKGNPTTYVIDGKQRLTAMWQYLKGHFHFGRVLDSEDVQLDGFNLIECKNKKYEDLPEMAKNQIYTSNLQTVEISNIDKSMLYQIFEIYNTTGTRLNATEIRNAAYHDEEIHRMLMSLAGESNIREGIFDDEEEQKAFTNELRTTIGNGNSEVKRYAAIGFLERYLAYSRASVNPTSGNFSRLSTSKLCRAYHETDARQEDPLMVAEEIRRVWNRAKEVFENDPDGPFHHAGRFHGLKATTSMIVALLADAAIVSGMELDDAAKLADEIRTVVDWPEKQQTGIIWKYQASWVTKFVVGMQDSDQQETVGAKFKNLIDRMHSIPPI